MLQDSEVAQKATSSYAPQEEPPMYDYQSIRAQEELNPNSTKAIAIIRMNDMLNEQREVKREARKAFFKKLFGRA
jgi:hypothetical protein